MNKSGLDILCKLPEKKKAILIDKLPVSDIVINIKGRVNTAVWGIKHPNYNLHDLSWFSISNIINSKINKKYSYFEKLNWEKHFGSVTNNPGQIFEYFLVDFLERTSTKYQEYRKQKYRFKHVKGTPEQDGEKIDFLSTMITKGPNKKIKDNLTIGVQLTTEKSNAIFQKDKKYSRFGMVKKEEQIRDATVKILEKTIGNFPRLYSPDMMALLIVNSNINKKLNTENINTTSNIFKLAFNEWRKRGFTQDGPSQYLENEIREDFRGISACYHFGLKMLFKFLQHISNKKSEVSPEFRDLQKFDDFYIISSYREEKQEYKLEFFKNGGPKMEFLMSLTFIINKNILEKINHS